MAEPVLNIQNLSIAYPHQARSSITWAVQNLHLTLAAGEKLALVGESGSGKSTVGKAVLRLLPKGCRVEGTIQLAGRDVFRLTQPELRRLRGESVGLVFQDPMTRLDPLMTIGDHCLETLQAHQPQLSRQQAKARAIAVLETVKIPATRWSQYPHEFSGGMRQRVAIALALLLDPPLIIADEPTTSLDVTVSAQILQELTRLCQEQQRALLLISHDLALVGEFCDRLAVMHQGQVVETAPTRELLQSPQHPYSQTLIQSALHLHSSPPPCPLPATPPSPILCLHDLKQHYTLEIPSLLRWFGQPARLIRAVDGISLTLHAGETLGLVGESGCGKSTLSRTILQLLRPTAGRVEFLGQDLACLSGEALRQERRRLQMIFQDPRACLNPLMTIGESIADPLVIHHLATPTTAKPQVLAMLERVKLTPAKAFYDRYPGDLSGGQQQRVAIARALITHPQLVICDEPVSMLDATVQAQVLELMQELKQVMGLTYLFITHDLAVARFFCDRIAVMQAGQIVELAETATLFAAPQHPYTQKLLSAAPLLSVASR